jgi:hypothetical protein
LHNRDRLPSAAREDGSRRALSSRGIEATALHDVYAAARVRQLLPYARFAEIKLYGGPDGRPLHPD